MTSSSADGSRRALEKFAAGAELLRILDDSVTAKSETLQQLLCAAARLAGEAAAGAGQLKAAQVDATKAQCTIPDLTFTTPWGKFSLMLLDDRLVLSNAKSEIQVPFTAIMQVAILDRFPKDAKERVVIFIVLDKAAGVMSGKQRLDSLVLQVLATNNLKVQVLGDDEALEGPAPVVLCSVLGKAGVDGSAFASPEDDVYLNAAGGPYLTATFKANTGWLYPLENALYFVERPPMYLPHSEISSYELQRVNSSLSTFELVLRMKDSKAPRIEFNISRLELGRLESYLQRSRLKVFGAEQAVPRGKAGAKAAPAVAADQQEEQEDEEDEEGEEEDEDEDFDPEASDDSCGPARPSKRTRRGDAEEAGPSSRPAGGDAGEESEDEASSGGDEEEDEDDDGSGSVEYTDEEDIPASAIKAKMQKEKVEVKRRR